MNNRKINIVAGIITLTIVLMVLAFTLRAEDAPALPKLTELEDARYVSAYKTVLLSIQDVEQATARRDKALQQFNTLQQQLRDAHKWAPQTKIDIDTRAEEWHSVVTLPPPSALPPPSPSVPDSKKQSNEKEKH